LELTTIINYLKDEKTQGMVVYVIALLLVYKGQMDMVVA
jgi:hypothetical protein